MSHQNSSVINLRKCYRAKNEKAIINGNRNAIFLPGVGRYKGTWKNNVRDGLGTLTTKDDIIYEGSWKNDKKHGYGLLQRKLKSQRVLFSPIYDGEWKFDKRYGDGKAYYENGVYEGQWKDDNRDGLGIMTLGDGSYYVGEWKNDLYHGIGALHDANGTFHLGYFRNGKKCGEGTLNYINKGQTLKGIWLNGFCVTSILQSDVQNENIIPLKECIPAIGLANPVGVIADTLQNMKEKDEQKQIMKSTEKQIAFNI